MSDSNIEQGIPVPPKKRCEIEANFPELLCLGKGDSFVIPKGKANFALHISIAMFSIRNGQRHEVREIENGDYRVWRTE